MNRNGKTDAEVEAFLDDLAQLMKTHGLAVRGLGLIIDRLGPCNGLHAVREPDKNLSLREHMKPPEAASFRIISKVAI